MPEVVIEDLPRILPDETHGFGTLVMSMIASMMSCVYGDLLSSPRCGALVTGTISATTATRAAMAAEKKHSRRRAAMP